MVLTKRIAIFVGLAATCVSACEQPSQALTSTKAAEARSQCVFEGLDLGDFAEAFSLASSLHPRDLEAIPNPRPPGLVVKGPMLPEQSQQLLSAEVCNRIDGIDLSAGMQADPTSIRDGPAKWVGGLGLSADSEAGRDALEVRTSLGQNNTWGLLALEIGPRVERRLPGGILFFMDAKAEATSLFVPQGATSSLPGVAPDGLSLIGLAGRTGLLR